MVKRGQIVKKNPSKHYISDREVWEDLRFGMCILSSKRSILFLVEIKGPLRLSQESNC